MCFNFFLQIPKFFLYKLYQSYFLSFVTNQLDFFFLKSAMILNIWITTIRHLICFNFISIDLKSIILKLNLEQTTVTDPSFSNPFLKAIC
jgi:hypothetical protein